MRVLAEYGNCDELRQTSSQPLGDHHGRVRPASEPLHPVYEMKFPDLFLFLFQCIITDAAGKCGPPPPVKNGDFLGLATSEYMPGARVRYKCQALYNMQGDEYVRCVNGHWTDTPTCIAPCTATEEDMNQNNIQLKWKYANKIYSASGDVTEFDCKRGFQKDPSSPPFRAQCREGKLDYPRCIPVGTLQLKHNYRKFNTHSCDFC
uniref:complement factor H-related protein 3-like n=1 Tax=Podarcis muralis TaxID=64176 RepID=UPI00109FF2D3|nr:complement factor H-related protein 3-like [Podarcis muralis]